MQVYRSTIVLWLLAFAMIPARIDHTESGLGVLVLGLASRSFLHPVAELAFP